MPRTPGKLITSGLTGLAMMITTTVLSTTPMQSQAAETALAAGATLRIQISADCQNGSTVFKVKNAGQSWPKPSTFAIYRIRDGQGSMISKRRMRLAEGQYASFRIKAARNPTGKLGIAVHPGWYQRQVDFDATASCR